MFRLSAIAQNELSPSLRRLAKRDMAANSIPGAAQVSLAKLGDKKALRELEEELKENPFRYAVAKLARVNDDAAISILMTYFVSHQSDDSLSLVNGDEVRDVRWLLLGSVANNIPEPPAQCTSCFDTWVKWWEVNKGKPLALSISKNLRIRICNASLGRSNGDFRMPFLI
jgi:hypothetical protein